VLVTGAAGQDGRFLVPELLSAGAEVHVLVRNAVPARAAFQTAEGRERIKVHVADLAQRMDPSNLLREIVPDYVFNLAGQSSVSESFANPTLSWRVNADWVATLLEAVRLHAPETRFYQSSSSEMFGGSNEGTVVHDEASPLLPCSPYAAAKAAAHLFCRAYREGYGLRIACGILFNHESRFRGPQFLTSKITSHVVRLRSMTAGERAKAEPLRVGNLDARRDWGYAAEFAHGILRIANQTDIRGESRDDPHSYRDYVLGTGRLTSVRDLITTAFRHAGFELAWDGPRARFTHGGIAVLSDVSFFRPGDPPAIQADPTRIRAELGWVCNPGVDGFLRDMMGNEGLRLSGVHSESLQ
jgi:GDPmannose 4,6-dehydratase